ncbi:MAG: diguanylate cyclase [Gemmatimonadetes bacterium]|nr:diguanylate cyclase [Gemmatimonadota bacterium]
MAARQPLYLSLRSRLAIAYACLALLVSASLTAALMLTLRAQMRRNLEDHLCRLVAVAATGIDVDAHRTLRSPADEPTPAYAKVRRQLQHVRTALGAQAAYVYTMREDAEGKVVFVVDAETDPDLVSHLGDVYEEASPWLREHVPLLATPAVEPGLNTDGWGTWMSGFAPIRTSQREYDGVIGVDVSAAAVLEAEHRMLRIALLSFLATVPLAGALGWWLGRRLARPVTDLRDATVRLSEGDFTAPPQPGGRDEIGDLGRAFGAMAERLQESHDELEARVAGRTAELHSTNEQLRMEIEVRKRLEAELREMSQRDGLTGLANRTAFDERLDQEWRQAARAGRPVSLIMCDVDHFKAYNDHHGHLAGDACLRAVGDVVRRTLCRGGEFPARWGGEEFAIVLADTDAGGAASAAERLREAVEQEALPRGDGKSPVVTVSVGFATAYPAWRSAPADLQAAADEALYAAKGAGRNCARQAAVA